MGLGGPPGVDPDWVGLLVASNPQVAAVNSSVHKCYFMFCSLCRLDTFPFVCSDAAIVIWLCFQLLLEIDIFDILGIIILSH